MNDDDDFTLLASAYLDNEVTPDERAHVDADPELLAEVERLRTVRLVLADMEPSSITMREAHLAGALDAWDRLPATERTGARRDATPSGIDAAAIAGAASVTAPTPLARRRSGPSTRWLTGAAAALVLVLVGGVAFQLNSRGSDEASSATASSGTQALAARDAQLAGSSDNADAPANAGIPTPAGTVDTGIDVAAPPGEDAGLDELQSPADLADFAAAAIDAPVAPDVPAATSPSGGEELSQAQQALDKAEFPKCLGVDIIVGPAVYIDEPVVVGIDESRNLAFAYRAATCAEVARARLP